MFPGCTDFALNGMAFYVRHAYPSVANLVRSPGSLER